MYRCALSPVSARTTTRVLLRFADCSTALKSEWNPPATISTAARNLSRAMNICSWVCACATMRISSSTASTLAIPARKIAWLSARISLSIESAPQATLAANKIVRIDDASYTARIPTAATGCRLIAAHHPSLAVDNHVFLGSGDFRWQSNFELHGGAYFHGGIGPDVNSGGAQVSRHPAVFSTLVCPMDLDGQFQGKAFSRPCFGHKTSSFLASLASKSQLHTALLMEGQNLLNALISRKIPLAKAGLPEG